METPTRRQRQLTRKIRKTFCAMDLAASACDSQLHDRAAMALAHLRNMGELDQFNIRTEEIWLHVDWMDHATLSWVRCIFHTKSLNPGSIDNDDVMDICEDVMES